MGNITDTMIDRAYELAKLVRTEAMKPSDATRELEQEMGMAPKSAVAYMHALRHLARGDRYTRRISNTAAKRYLQFFERDDGRGGLERALTSFKAHTQYLENTRTKQSQPGMWRIIDEFSRRLGREPIRIESLANFRGREEAEWQTARTLTMEELKARALTARAGPVTPVVLTTAYRQRNPFVREYVLRQAAGICQACGEPAPFKRKGYKEPFLEVHHLIPLAEDGDDTVENAIALCPNCHREAHHGEHWEKFRP